VIVRWWGVGHAERSARAAARCDGRTAARRPGMPRSGHRGAAVPGRRSHWPGPEAISAPSARQRSASSPSQTARTGIGTGLSGTRAARMSADSGQGSAGVRWGRADRATIRSGRSPPSQLRAPPQCQCLTRRQASPFPPRHRVNGDPCGPYLRAPVGNRAGGTVPRTLERGISRFPRHARAVRNTDSHQLCAGDRGGGQSRRPRHRPGRRRGGPRAGTTRHTPAARGAGTTPTARSVAGRTAHSDVRAPAPADCAIIRPGRGPPAHL
jgi:hypothetical protein